MAELAIVKPVTIADAMVISTNVAEAETLWSSFTAYVTGDLVRYGHSMWKALVNNSAKTPGAVGNETFWEKAYPTNAWACFDTSNSTKTSNAAAINITLRPGRTVNSVALLGVVATSARVRMVDPTDGTVYDRTYPMVEPISTASFYEYFFSPVRYRQQVILLDLPAYSTADILIDITGPSTVALAGVVMGFLTRLPATIERGSRFGTTSFTKKEVNAYGNTVITPKPYARRAVVRALVPNSHIEALDALLVELDSLPALYALFQEWRPLNFFGYLQEYEWETTEPPTHTWLRMAVTGMT